MSLQEGIEHFTVLHLIDMHRTQDFESLFALVPRLTRHRHVQSQSPFFPIVFELGNDSCVRIMRSRELKGYVHWQERVLVVPVVVPKVLFSFVTGTLNRHPFIHCEQVIHAPSKGYKAKIPAPVEDARILKVARRGPREHLCTPCHS